METWLKSPSLVLLSEQTNYWPVLEKLLSHSRVCGPQIHDARVIALCIQHGVHEIWSADRDFNRFVGISVSNPLIG